MIRQASYSQSFELQPSCIDEALAYLNTLDRFHRHNLGLLTHSKGLHGQKSNNRVLVETPNEIYRYSVEVV